MKFNFSAALNLPCSGNLNLLLTPASMSRKSHLTSSITHVQACLIL